MGLVDNPRLLTNLPAQVSSFIGRDGELATVRALVAGSRLVAVTVADVLGVRQQPGRPVLDAVAEAVGERSLLVLLDNCEHLIGACAKLADTLLRSCPNLALLATSREPLGVNGERVYRVPPWAFPPTATTPRRSGRASRCGCSRTGPTRKGCPWPGTQRPPRSWGGSAGGWTASRWPSSWPRRGCG